MKEAGLLVVDTSVWIHFFRNADSPETNALDELLSAGLVAICSPIRTEVISGAPTKHEFQRLRKLFEALILLEPPEDIWIQIEEHRFNLARKGIQASLVDLWIALTVRFHHTALWTLDNDFYRLTPIIPLSLYRCPNNPS